MSASSIVPAALAAMDFAVDGHDSSRLGAASIESRVDIGAIGDRAGPERAEATLPGRDVFASGPLLYVSAAARIQTLSRYTMPVTIDQPMMGVLVVTAYRPPEIHSTRSGGAPLQINWFTTLSVQYATWGHELAKPDSLNTVPDRSFALESFAAPPPPVKGILSMGIQAGRAEGEWAAVDRTPAGLVRPLDDAFPQLGSPLPTTHSTQLPNAGDSSTTVAVNLSSLANDSLSSLPQSINAVIVELWDLWTDAIWTATDWTPLDWTPLDWTPLDWTVVGETTDAMDGLFRFDNGGVTDIDSPLVNLSLMSPRTTTRRAELALGIDPILVDSLVSRGEQWITRADQALEDGFVDLDSPKERQVLRGDHALTQDSGLLATSTDSQSVISRERFGATSGHTFDRLRFNTQSAGIVLRDVESDTAEPQGADGEAIARADEGGMIELGIDQRQGNRAAEAAVAAVSHVRALSADGEIPMDAEIGIHQSFEVSTSPGDAAEAGEASASRREDTFDHLDKQAGQQGLSAGDSVIKSEPAIHVSSGAIIIPAMLASWKREDKRRRDERNERPARKVS